MADPVNFFNLPPSGHKQNPGFVQTFHQQLIYHLLNDQRAHECIITYECINGESHDIHLTLN